MKKLLTLSLALVLVMSLCAVAFAANNNTLIDAAGETNTQDVTLNQIDVETEYNVVVEFGSFAYDLELQWNPEDVADTNPGDTIDDAITGHTYTATLTPVQDGVSNNITVTNHSNVAVTASYAFAEDAAVAAGVDINAVYDGFTVGTPNRIESAAVFAGAYGNYDGADSDEVDVDFTIVIGAGFINGQAITTSGNTIGTITVTINAAA